MRSDGTLVPPEQANYPAIPVTHYAGWPALPAFDYMPETMNRNAPLDFSVVPYVNLPGPEYAVLVTQVDSDGNDVAGIRLPYLVASLGTHTGWSVLKDGAGFPDTCGQNGTFIPFAKTKAERVAVGDPRPSLEERYRNHGAYVSTVARAAARLVQDGFLLGEDKDRIVERAASHGVDLWLDTLQ